MLEDRKGFVFTGISLLLTIPAIVLMASFINMLNYGNLGVQVAVSGDNVFYTCDNLLSFLVDGARDGGRSTAISMASAYADQRNINFTATPLTVPYYQIAVEDDGRMKCNRTIDLRNGTLNVDLTLSNNVSEQNGLPVYFRVGGNSTINTTTFVTYPSGGPVNGANVTLVALGTSFTNLTNASGYTNQSINISSYYDLSLPTKEERDCSTKSVLGQNTAVATATKPDYYDGVDTEDFLVLGNISNANVEGYKPTKTTLGLKITLLDDFDFPVSQYPSEDSGGLDLDCGDNYTAPFPTITAELHETSVPNLVATWNSPINISEEKQGATTWDGIFWTNDSGYTFTVANTYYAVVSVSQPGYLPVSMTKEVTFTDFRATSLAYGDGGGICKGSVGGPIGNKKTVIQLTITNIGTTDDSVWQNYTIAYYHTNATNLNQTLFYTYSPGGSAKRGADPWTICSDPLLLGGGVYISANLTAVSTPNLDIDLSNNYINSTTP
jgi:hypothetical protein